MAPDDRITLLLGYGNCDRQDDGVAWHVLAAAAGRLGVRLEVTPADLIEPTPTQPAFYFCLQLTPELAETISHYDRVVFIDAHTGAVPELVSARLLSPGYQPTPFTHHLSAESCLALSEALYGRRPAGLMVSIRGYEFGYTQTLSDRTAALILPAVAAILEWLETGSVQVNPTSTTDPAPNTDTHSQPAISG